MIIHSVTIRGYVYSWFNGGFYCGSGNFSARGRIGDAPWSAHVRVSNDLHRYASLGEYPTEQAARDAVELAVRLGLDTAPPPTYPDYAKETSS